jgi:hypothetical protein
MPLEKKNVNPTNNNSASFAPLREDFLQLRLGVKKWE